VGEDFYMKVVIDRFEGEYAVCEKENREMIDVKRDSLPKEAKEGDVLNILDRSISVDVEETEKRKKEIEDLTKDLWA
jgi:pyruvate kinase